MSKQPLGHSRALEKIGCRGSRRESSITVSQCDAGLGSCGTSSYILYPRKYF
jgi:hypothetical protein